MASHRASLTAALADQRSLSQKVQADAHQTELINALRVQRARLKGDYGVMDGALPDVHPGMSASDIALAQSRMDGLTQLHQSRAGASPTVPTGSAPAGPSPVDAQLATQARTAGLAVAGASPTAIGASGAVPITAPAVPDLPARTALETAVDQLPMQNGMRPHVTQTGAGLVATVNSQSGPREVAVSPTFEQMMHARTGGKWGSMTIPQRAQWLRSNPAPSPSGEVTDRGAGAFDYRGERVLGEKTLTGGVRTPGGDRRTPETYEYIRRHDTMGGDAIRQKYGGDPTKNGVRFVHPADAALPAPDASPQPVAVNGVSPASAHNDVNTGGNAPTVPAPTSNVATTSPTPAAPTAGNPLAAVSTPPAPTGTDQAKAAVAGLSGSNVLAEPIKKFASYFGNLVQGGVAPAPVAGNPVTPPVPSSPIPAGGIQQTKNVAFQASAASGVNPVDAAESLDRASSPLAEFAKNPQDAAFKKRLTSPTAYNDGK